MNREVHVRIWERPEVRALWATRHEDQFPPPWLSARYRFSQGTFAGTRSNERDAPTAGRTRTSLRTARLDQMPKFGKRQINDSGKASLAMGEAPTSSLQQRHRALAPLLLDAWSLWRWNGRRWIRVSGRWKEGWRYG
jgi:hypothetical protein